MDLNGTGIMLPHDCTTSTEKEENLWNVILYLLNGHLKEIIGISMGFKTCGFVTEDVVNIFKWLDKTPQVFHGELNIQLK